MGLLIDPWLKLYRVNSMVYIVTLNNIYVIKNIFNVLSCWSGLFWLPVTGEKIHTLIVKIY